MKFVPVPPGGSVLRLKEGPESVQSTQVWVDGTVKKAQMGGGAWATDGCNEWEACWRFDAASTDSTQAEALALLSALEQAPSEVLQGAVVYTDSYQLVEHLLKAQKGVSPRYPELSAILAQLSQKGVTLVQNVERRLNKKADALARKGLGMAVR